MIDKRQLRLAMLYAVLSGFMFFEAFSRDPVSYWRLALGVAGLGFAADVLRRHLKR